MKILLINFFATFCFVIIFSIFFPLESLSQNFSELDEKEDLELKGDVIAVYEKVIAVKGTRHNLLRRNVISETEYQIIGEKVLVKSVKIKGNITEYKYNATTSLTVNLP